MTAFHEVNQQLRKTVETFTACTSLPICAITDQGYVAAYAGDELPNALSVHELQSVHSQITRRAFSKAVGHIDLPLGDKGDLQVTAVPLISGSIRLGMYIIGPFSKWQLKTCVHFLIGLLKNIQENQANTTPDYPTNLHVRRAIRYVHQHFSEPLTLEGMAEELGINKSYLANVFRAEMGETFIDFVNRFRIEMSKKALVDGTEPILNIAMQHGFASQNYYGRVFKKLTGVTPSEFRRQAQIKLLSV